MIELLDTVRAVQQDVVRNIVKVLSVEEVFSDLQDDKMDGAKIAEAAIHRVTQAFSDYTVAIGYPFETDHFMASRYSDGTFPAWYGSMDKVTTIHETVHHMIRTETAVKGIEHHEVVIRSRVIYNVFCRGLLIDLTGKAKDYPAIIADSYEVTQKIGQQIHEQGYPGLLAPSVRYHNGINVTVLNEKILQQPRVDGELTYRLFPTLKKVEIFESNNSVKFDEIYY